MNKPEREVTIVLTISEREFGGIRVRGGPEFEDIYVAGTVANVMHDLGPVVRTILVENHGVEWLRESATSN